MSRAGQNTARKFVLAGGTLPAEQVCTACHDSFELNPDELEKLELAGVPERYKADEKYRITLTLSHHEAARWGFQLTSVFAGNAANADGSQSGDRIYASAAPLAISLGSGTARLSQHTTTVLLD
jgi:hypothetical protein